MDEEAKREVAQEFGGRGGRKTSRLYGIEHYRFMQKKSVQAKLKKKNHAQIRT